jgi:hypothetical protein
MEWRIFGNFVSVLVKWISIEMFFVVHNNKINSFEMLSKILKSEIKF